MDSTLISIAVPCGNRLHDLKQTLPYLVETANISPPVEIFILDYASTDGLEDYMKKFIPLVELTPGNSISFKRYPYKDYFHKAHALNLAILSSHGEYFCLLGSDAIPSPNYIKTVRELINDGCIWGHAEDVCGIIFCQREEFIEAGGYDERIEFYGGEDRDLDSRLIRRGSKFGLVPEGLMKVIPTSNNDKIKNYRLPLSKREMTRRTHIILDENNEKGILVANPNGWGKWE